MQALRRAAVVVVFAVALVAPGSAGAQEAGDNKSYLIPALEVQIGRAHV